VPCLGEEKSRGPNRLIEGESLTWQRGGKKRTEKRVGETRFLVLGGRWVWVRDLGQGGGKNCLRERAHFGRGSRLWGGRKIEESPEETSSEKSDPEKKKGVPKKGIYQGAAPVGERTWQQKEGQRCRPAGRKVLPTSSRENRGGQLRGLPVQSPLQGGRPGPGLEMKKILKGGGKKKGYNLKTIRQKKKKKRDLPRKKEKNLGARRKGGGRKGRLGKGGRDEQLHLGEKKKTVLQGEKKNTLDGEWGKAPAQGKREKSSS